MQFFNFLYQHGHIAFSQYIYRIGTYHYNWHPEIEVLLVLQGAVEVCHDSEYTNLGPEDIIILPPQCGHATLALEPDTIAMVLHLHPQMLAQYDAVFRQSRFFLATDETNRHNPAYEALRSRLSGLMRRLAKHEADETKTINVVDKPDIAIETEFLSILHCFISLLKPVSYVPQGNPVALQQAATFEKMITYIDQHYKEPLTLGEIADIGGYTESYASQFFKRQLGISFKAYLLRMRLREAAVQLVNTKQQIVDIANECGFSDVKAFNTAFRKHFHTTPSEYRRIAGKVERHTMMDNWKEYIAVDDEGINERLASYIGGEFATNVATPAEEQYVDGNQQSGVVKPLISNPETDDLQAAREQLRLALATLDDVLDK